mgnify:FL=1|tara:strand:- start:7581 stop:8567 length:987 start_codon:yes stop_codon:yes gene_type:complete
MKKNNIAIIGGSGFLGSRLAKRLNNKKASLKIFDKKKCNEDISEIDIEKPESLNQLEGTDTLINLAALHRDDIKPITRYDDVNVRGSVNICNVARKYKINKIIFTSSVAIYGFAPPNTDESGEPNYFNDYGRTKYLAEQVYKEWHAEDPENRTLVIVRPTVIFGEGNRGNVYNLLKQIASRKFVMFGNGKNIKSMAYVENVAAFLEYSTLFDSGLHIYNYIDKPDFDMNKLISMTRNTLFNKYNVGIRLPAFLGIVIGYFADLISKITGINLPISSIRVKKFMGTTKFSSSIDQTDFIKPISLEDALIKTLHYEFLEDNSEKEIFETE